MKTARRLLVSALTLAVLAVAAGGGVAAAATLPSGFQSEVAFSHL